MSKVRVTPGSAPGVASVLIDAAEAGEAAEVVQVGKRGVAVKVGKTLNSVNNRGKVTKA